MTRVFEAPQSGKELTSIPDVVDSHKYNGGVGEGVLEQFSTWAFWPSSLAMCGFSSLSFCFFLWQAISMCPLILQKLHILSLWGQSFLLMFFGITARALFFVGWPLSLVAKGWFLLSLTCWYWERLLACTALTSSVDFLKTNWACLYVRALFFMPLRLTYTETKLRIWAVCSKGRGHYIMNQSL